MYNFEALEALYNSISSVENSVAEFSECAIYELDGGISEWIKTKKIILENISRQKQLLRSIRDENFDISDEQQLRMQAWNLD